MNNMVQNFSHVSQNNLLAAMIRITLKLLLTNKIFPSAVIDSCPAARQNLGLLIHDEAALFLQ